MNSYDVGGKVAVVTGGAQGIGGAVATLLAAGGARVALWDLDAALARTHAATIGGGAIAVAADVADWTLRKTMAIWA
jgi:3-oxoacyl-[acyl-carrier protein] reductase